MHWAAEKMSTNIGSVPKQPEHRYRADGQKFHWFTNRLVLTSMSQVRFTLSFTGNVKPMVLFCQFTAAYVALDPGG